MSGSHYKGLIKDTAPSNWHIRKLCHAENKFGGREPGVGTGEIAPWLGNEAGPNVLVQVWPEGVGLREMGF